MAPPIPCIESSVLWLLVNVQFRRANEWSIFSNSYSADIASVENSHGEYRLDRPTTNSTAPFVLRPATPSDAGSLIDMFQQLASFEGASHPPHLDHGILERDVFTPTPRLHVLIAETLSPDTTPHLIGFVSWFKNYSSWEGREGLHICDLWVSESTRRKGVASALLSEVSKVCDGRLDVFVKRENRKAQTFYESMGFRERDEWCLYRRTSKA